MNCKKCGADLPESNFTGICGKCAFSIFQNARTEPLRPVREKSAPDADTRSDRQASAPSDSRQQAPYEQSQQQSDLNEEIEITMAKCGRSTVASIDSTVVVKAPPL